jgi:NAD+ diphosphatase
MLQEIAPYIFNNQYRPQSPTAESYGLCYAKKTILVRKNENEVFDLPTFQELEVGNTDIYENFTYLFSMDNQTFFLPGEIKLPKGFDWEPITETMKAKPQHLAFAAVTGYQLFNWYESRKYCGRCGASLFKEKKTRSLSCPVCGQIEYPKIAPAVLVGVINGNRLLLAEYPNYDKYALLAGFAEIGETLEETVKREVMEEVGLKVKNIRYYKSQPSSLSDNLMVGFFCEVDETDKINFDAEELSNAVWFEKGDIPLGDDYVDGSLTYEMMNQFKNRNII